MAGSKSGKPGPLDTFWDTFSGASGTSGSMSDLLSSLPGAPSTRKAPQKKERPVQREEPKDDPILLLIRVLYKTEGQELPIVEILKQTRIGPSDVLAGIEEGGEGGPAEPKPKKTPAQTYRVATAGGENNHRENRPRIV